MVNDQLHAASSKFAFKLYDQLLKQRSSKNTFVSPASVMLALAMTYNGAGGTTREAMARVLEIEDITLDEINRAFAVLKSALNPTDPKIQLKIANSLWLREDFVLIPAFIKRNQDHYKAELTRLDFEDPGAVETINSWVSRNTEGKIDQIINQIEQDQVLFLINAIYFKGQWQSAFDKEDTKRDVFKVPRGQLRPVDMMSQHASYFYNKGTNFQAVELPYGEGSVSMYVFLPDQQTTLDQFERSLTTENWDTWMRGFRRTPGDLLLPRFKIEWESSLKDALQALGMTVAFHPEQANFTQMAEVTAENNLFISEVKHKAWAEVNEAGTEAAAATVVVMALRSKAMPEERFYMKVDRPFFFAIRDNSTGVVLFMGSVTDPGDA